MASCDLRSSCLFYTKPVLDMPHTTEYLKERYCEGDRYPECALYWIAKTYGMDKVPRYLYPNDIYELLDFNLFEPEEDAEIFIKVIFSDGSFGKVRPSTLRVRTRSQEIVALKSSMGWVELRRKQNIGYNGQDRRHRCSI